MTSENRRDKVVIWLPPKGCGIDVDTRNGVILCGKPVWRYSDIAVVRSDVASALSSFLIVGTFDENPHTQDEALDRLVYVAPAIDFLMSRINMYEEAEKPTTHTGLVICGVPVNNQSSAMEALSRIQTRITKFCRGGSNNGTVNLANLAILHDTLEARLSILEKLQ